MANLKKDELRSLLKTMVRARIFEERVSELFTQAQIPGFIHAGIGQEGIAAGVCANLRPDDAIFTTHRGHCQAVAKGIDLKRAMAELFGKETGFCRGKAGSMHLCDKSVGVMGAMGIVGGGIPVANGVALSFQYRGTDQVAVVFFGDGAANEGTFHESLNMASVWDLPIIFCCENNGWAQFTSQKLITKVLDISTRAAGYAMLGVTVDGDDVLAVYDAAKEAIKHARKGEGPTLLECKTHRWFGHYVGDPQRYRAPEDIEEARKHDPIAAFQTKLIADKVITADYAEQIKAEVMAEIGEAIKFAQESPLPDPKDALKDIYYEGDK